jgi:hypothetical protein
MLLIVGHMTRSGTWARYTDLYRRDVTLPLSHQMLPQDGPETELVQKLDSTFARLRRHRRSSIRPRQSKKLQKGGGVVYEHFTDAW